MNKEIKVISNQDIINSDWYKLLIEECGAIITETTFIAHWTLVEGYHQLGCRIIEDMDKFKEGGIYGKRVVKMIASSIRKSERTLYYAQRYVELYPDINSTPEGKNITWSKLCKVYLSNKAGECLHDDFREVVIKVCNCCGKKMEKENHEGEGYRLGLTPLSLP